MGKASKRKRFKRTVENTPSAIPVKGASSAWLGSVTLHLILIVVLGILAYSNTFDVPFTLDDRLHIVKNYTLRNLSNFWPPSGSRWFGYLTFALNYYFGGLNVASYHIVNLIIHIFNAILVYWLVILTFKTPYFSPPFNSLLAKGGYRGVALFSALLFVAHPIQTQAVTYIVQRFASLATMFYLLSLAGYIRSRLSTLHAARYTLYAVSFFSAIFAMKTKEIAFTLPIIIVIYEFMFFEGNIKKRVLHLIPMLLTMLIIPLSLVGIDKPIGDTIGELKEAAQETGEIPRWSYLFTQFRVIVTYIRLLFFPINQNLYYDYPIYHSFFNPEVFLSLLFLLSILGLGVFLFYRSHITHNAGSSFTTRLIAFGIFWFFITLSVESSVIPITDLIFEHRVYLPSVGVFLSITVGAFLLTGRLKSKKAKAFAVLSFILIPLVFSYATYARNRVWRSETSLWEDVVMKSPKKARGYFNIGNAYAYRSMDMDRAIEHLRIAIRLDPYYADAHFNLGLVYLEKGFREEARKEFNATLQINPAYAQARLFLNYIANQDKTHP